MDHGAMEQIVLSLGDMFDVRVEWTCRTALATSVCALAGGLVGGCAGGRVGAAVGAGLGGVAGLGVAKMVSLREVWSSVKEQLAELLYIVFNFLRQLDALDCLHACEMLLASRASRGELAYVIVEFITVKLGREVISNMITA